MTLRSHASRLALMVLLVLTAVVLASCSSSHRPVADSPGRAGQAAPKQRPAADTAGDRETASRERRRPQADKRSLVTPEQLGRMQPQDGWSQAFSASTASGALDFEPELDVDLASFDEVWVIARHEPAAERAPLVESCGPTGLLGQTPESEEDLPFPLEHTDVRASIDGHVSSVWVQQRYHNPYNEKIEAVYVFPLPHDSAVSEFIMTVGERRIRGIIREREEAEQVYRQARQQGHVASLLTQERPNVFTQSVANIEPGKRIDIDLRYFSTLPYRDGRYEFVFPTVVGPRFNPPGSKDGIGAASVGAHGSTGQATEIQYLAPGQSTGHSVSLSVELDAGIDVEAVDSPTHVIDTEYVDAHRRRITLRDATMHPDRDFVLTYQVAGRETRTAFLHHDEADGSTFTLMLHPPEKLLDLKRAPMEHVFVLDCSGSMSGQPMAIAKRAARRVLERLDERDSFQIIRFSSNASQLGPVPVRATRANVAKGLRYLDRLNGGGGTHMIEGIKAALDFPHDEERLRLVTFMTDGFIGNEHEILAAIHPRLGPARIFSFGVGTSVNRHLLDSMARVGRGAVAYIGLNEKDAELEADAFYRRISHPALADLEIDWGGMKVHDVQPTRLPDLFHGRPVVLTGRVHGRLAESITVRGRAGGLPLEIDVEIDRTRSERPGLVKVWARSKIADLERRLTAPNASPELRDEVLSMALHHGLMSQDTAFLAVDSLSRTEGDHGTTVHVPVPVPAGVRYDTTVQHGG